MTIRCQIDVYKEYLQIEQRVRDVFRSVSLDQLRKEIEKLQLVIADANLWENREQAEKVLKDLAVKRSKLETFTSWERRLQDLQDRKSVV